LFRVTVTQVFELRARSKFDARQVVESGNVPVDAVEVESSVKVQRV
jgi:hypothetical protein